jgi:hypothetical protein
MLNFRGIKTAAAELIQKIAAMQHLAKTSDKRRPLVTGLEDR